MPVRTSIYGSMLGRLLGLSAQVFHRRNDQSVSLSAKPVHPDPQTPLQRLHRLCEGGKIPTNVAKFVGCLALFPPEIKNLTRSPIGDSSKLAPSAFIHSTPRRCAQPTCLLIEPAARLTPTPHAMPLRPHCAQTMLSRATSQARGREVQA